MKLTVDGTPVILKYLCGGQKVQMRISATNGTNYPLHLALKETLIQVFNVSDQKEPDEEGFTEIRVFDATFLEVIDIIRLLGLGVREENPDQPKPEAV